MPRFSRSFNDWEIGEIQIFLNLINSRRTFQVEKNRIFWKGDPDGCYSVQTNLTLLEGVSESRTPWKPLWNSLVPAKVRFFAWEV